MELFSLAGKTALVTGGSYGIGFAIALALGRAGARILFNARHPEGIGQALEGYRREGIDAEGYCCDVTDGAAVEKMVRQIEERSPSGAVDILVNNAGIIKRLPMCEMTPEEFRQVVDVDLAGPFIMSRAVLPGMLRRPCPEGGSRGKIINVCSLMSELGRESVSAYAAAKGGLKMLTRSIASEFGRQGIQCNGIGPGYIATPQTQPLRQPQEDGSPHPFDSFLQARTPAGRWGVPEDLAGPAVFLASAASDYVNGQILYVDGGLLAYIGHPLEK